MQKPGIGQKADKKTERPTNNYDDIAAPRDEVSSQNPAGHRVLDKFNKPTNGRATEAGKTASQTPKNHRKLHGESGQGRRTIYHGTLAPAAPKTLLKGTIRDSANGRRK